jgi:hypothetical protein
MLNTAEVSNHHKVLSLLLTFSKRSTLFLLFPDTLPVVRHCSMFPLEQLAFYCRTTVVKAPSRNFTIAYRRLTVIFDYSFA